MLFVFSASITYLYNMRDDILERKDEILGWIEEGQSKAYICREIKCRPITLNLWLDKLSIDYKGNQGAKGIKKDPKRKTAKEYINSTYVQSDKLRKKLIEDGLKECKCEICNNSEWLGKVIPLELHHIDGDRFNNQLDNLQIICPNCHAQTDNYRAKNIKNG